MEKWYGIGYFSIFLISVSIIVIGHWISKSDILLGSTLVGVGILLLILVCVLVVYSFHMKKVVEERLSKNDKYQFLLSFNRFMQELL